MTRASLLHILDHATALGTDDVRELEQLAQAFPYCQTAHLLLAKAAHDQGTMLASQRLRRAATYAADRALLRQLIEAVPEARAIEAVEEIPADVVGPTHLVPANASTPEAMPATVAQVETAATTDAPVMAVAQETIIEPLAVLPTAEVVAPAQPPPQVTRIIPAAATVSTEVPAEATAAAVNAAPEMAAFVTPQTQVLPAVEAIATPQAVVAVAAPVVAPASVVETAPEVAAVPEATATPALAVVEIEVVPQVAATAPPFPSTSAIIEAEAEIVAIAESIPVVAAAPVEALFKLNEALLEAIPVASPDDVLAAAPPVRPPEEAVTARLEFGLSDEVPATPAYLLPGLTDEWTWPMPEKPKPVPILTPAAFTGDAEIGYGWGESSRLGWALLPLQTITADTSEAVDNVMSAAPVATPLPLVGDYFPPDALLLAHWAEHGPATLPPPSALDLIDNFLRQRPRLTRPTLHKATTEALADLSTPSTRPEPEMASETLAKILARQGKTGRAIEIYERLMVKQPEKMAYFAAEIQQLQLQQPPLA